MSHWMDLDGCQTLHSGVPAGCVGMLLSSETASPKPRGLASVLARPHMLLWFYARAYRYVDYVHAPDFKSLHAGSHLLAAESRHSQASRMHKFISGLDITPQIVTCGGSQNQGP